MELIDACRRTFTVVRIWIEDQGIRPYRGYSFIIATANQRTDNRVKRDVTVHSIEPATSVIPLAFMGGTELACITLTP